MQDFFLRILMRAYKKHMKMEQNNVKKNAVHVKKFLRLACLSVIQQDLPKIYVVFKKIGYSEQNKN